MNTQSYSIGADYFTIDIDRDFCDASLEVGCNIARFASDQGISITDDDAVLLSEEVVEGLQCGNPFQYILTPSDLRNFRIS